MVQVCAMPCLSALLSLLPLVHVAWAQTFVPPSTGPVTPSPNYGHPSNGSLPKQHVVHGKVFNRFIQIIYENTDFDSATSSPFFTEIAKEGITLTNYLGITHPSEPNYAAMVGGDFFGMDDDALHDIPANVSTIVDLLEEKHISWASYQESMPSDGDIAFSETQPNYITPGGPPSTYYVRKHNPLILYQSVSTVPERAKLIRNFNDFAEDFKHSALPQWIFITPNLVDDGHDTSVAYAGNWSEFFVKPLLGDERFNDDKTLIILTFDENETHGDNNFVLSILLGKGVPHHLRGTTDDTLYSHYSLLSTVESNWDLGCLGRNDANKTLANVFSFVAERTGYENVQVTDIPLTNLSGVAAGPFNPANFAPFQPPNIHAKCPGGGPVFVAH